MWCWNNERCFRLLTCICGCTHPLESYWCEMADFIEQSNWFTEETNKKPIIFNRVMFFIKKWFK